MSSYTKLRDQNNAHLEFVFEDGQDEQPTRRAVHQLAKQAGISELHARACLLANGLRHD